MELLGHVVLMAGSFLASASIAAHIDLPAVHLLHGLVHRDQPPPPRRYGPPDRPERVVHGRPLRNLMERMVQYLKEGAEAFDDPFPVGGRRLASGRAFERLRNWLPASTSMQDFVFEDGA